MDRGIAVAQTIRYSKDNEIVFLDEFLIICC